MLFIMDANGKNHKALTTDAKSESDATWIADGKRIAFIRNGQLWSMNPDGTDRKQLTHDKAGIEGFRFSPDGKKVILIKELPYHGTIKENPSDLPLATGRLVTDMNYRHWDHYVESILHPFVAEVAEDGTVNEGEDILKGEPYECPMAPFGGIEQLAWSPDSKTIAYTCRKKEGLQYAISTDSDIYLYNIGTRETKNLCKEAGYVEPKVDATKSMKHQAVNAPENLKNNPGYDTNPQFSADGKYIAWQSMARDGYESDRNRLCIYDLATGKKNYVTEKFDSNVEGFTWNKDNKSLTFIGVWHGTLNLYQTNFKGETRRWKEAPKDGVNGWKSMKVDKITAYFFDYLVVVEGLVGYLVCNVHGGMAYLHAGLKIPEGELRYLVSRFYDGRSCSRTDGLIYI